jgi:PhoH-like ATPase
MKTIFVLDTSVLIDDPQAYKHFENAEVVLPITVVDELDKLKKAPSEAGKNARVSIRLLEEISNQGDIHTGILLGDETLIRIDVNDYEKTGSALYGDTRILTCARTLQQEDPDAVVVLVSNDINLRLRAKAFGLTTESYESDKSDLVDLYTGIRYLTDEDAGSQLVSQGTLDAKDFGLDLFPNECVVFKDSSNNTIVKGRQIANGLIKAVKKIHPWALSPRNVEQEFAIDLIMDPKVPLMTMVGKAGCGKSLITLASALELVIEKHEYNKLVIYRPIQAVGNDIGYVPGTIEEKLAPWFSAIMDNIEILFTLSSGEKWKSIFERYRRSDKIQLEAITYIRGRSIPNALIFVDEVQNITREDIKTILTRVGENSKVILAGDIDQIDRRDLDAMDNGLSYVIEKFKGSPLAGHITFKHGERSPLATEAAKIL